jgi:UDP-glucuronate 4-epimerase
MAMWLFTTASFEGRTIKFFNDGEMFRDLSYIDNIVAAG